jgi:hypothetical protein
LTGSLDEDIVSSDNGVDVSDITRAEALTKGRANLIRIDPGNEWHAAPRRNSNNDPRPPYRSEVANDVHAQGFALRGPAHVIERIQPAAQGESWHDADSSGMFVR